MRNLETRAGQPLKSRIGLHLVLALAASLHAQVASPVTSVATEDGSRFLLLPTGGPPVVHWVVITPAGILEDPVGLMGLSHATALAALAGTDRIGSLDPVREASMLREVGRLEKEVATLRRRGADVTAELEASLTDARQAAARLSDPAAWWRLLLVAPASDVRHQLLNDATVLSLSTTTLGLPAVASLLRERSERALLRGVHGELRQVRERIAAIRASTPLAELRAEALALAFIGHPFGRLWARPGPPEPLTVDVAMQTWRRTQRPGRGLHVLIGGFSLEEVQTTLGEIFRDSDLNRDPAPVLREVPESNSTRRAAVPGGKTAAVVVGVPLPAELDRDVLEVATRWLAGGQDSFIARGLRQRGYGDVRVDGLAPFPAPGSDGLLLIEVEVLEGDAAAGEQQQLSEHVGALLALAQEQTPRMEDLQPIITEMATRHTSVRGAGDSLAYELAVQCGLLGRAPEDVLGPFRAPTSANCAELMGTVLGQGNRVEVGWELPR